MTIMAFRATEQSFGENDIRNSRALMGKWHTTCKSLGGPLLRRIPGQAECWIEQ
jgi:hypothetical protein